MTGKRTEPIGTIPVAVSNDQEGTELISYMSPERPTASAIHGDRIKMPPISLQTSSAERKAQFKSSGEK